MDSQKDVAPHETAPYKTAPHKTAAHETAAHESAAHETAAAVMPYVTAAIDAYGTGVLARTRELASATPMARGARILQRIFGRGDAASLEVIGAVAGAKPDDESCRVALRLAITQEFRADPLLRAEVAAMLPRTPEPASAGRDSSP